MTAMLRRERSTLRPIPAPGEFRFSDLNPLSSGTYAQSRFLDLPEHVAYVVTELHNISPADWNELVDLGEAYDYVSPFRVYAIKARDVFEVTDERGQTTASLAGQAALNEWSCA